MILPTRQLEPYQQHLIKEHNQLEERISNLSKFIDNDDTPFITLPTAEQLDLQIQLMVMKDLLIILNRRINRFLYK